MSGQDRIVWVAGADLTGEGTTVAYGFGTDPVRASMNLLGALRTLARDEPAADAQIGYGPDDALPRPVLVGGGYILATGDGLWTERGMEDATDEDALHELSEMWVHDADIGPATTQDTMWMGVGSTIERGHSIESYGTTPGKSLAAMLDMWIEDHAPESGAEPGYMHECMRDRVAFVQVPMDGSAVMRDGVWNHAVVPGSDPALDATWEAMRPRVETQDAAPSA